jgi:hypothetical protein
MVGFLVALLVSCAPSVNEAAYMRCVERTMKRETSGGPNLRRTWGERICQGNDKWDEAFPIHWHKHPESEINYFKK